MTESDIALDLCCYGCPRYYRTAVTRMKVADGYGWVDEDEF